MNYPDRNNFYQMMQACTTARSNSKTPEAIQPNNFRLTFGGDKQISRAERNKRALEIRDARIASRGGLSRYTIMDAQGNIVRPPTEQTNTAIKFNGAINNPLLRGPTPEEFNAFRERRRAAAQKRPNDPRIRNPRSSADGNG